jgi:hypothetical protein
MIDGASNISTVPSTNIDGAGKAGKGSNVRYRITADPDR